MKNTTALNNSIHWNLYLAVFSASLPIAIGLMALLGWHLNLLWLIQVNPNFAILDYKSALIMLSGGLGLLLCLNQSSTLNYLMANFVIGTIISLSLLSIFENLLGSSWHLFPSQIYHPIEATIIEAVMPTNVAFGTLITGIGLGLLHHSNPNSKIRIILSIFIGVLISTFGILSLFGYVSDISSSYGWGLVSRMSLQIAICFIALGIGIAICAWRISVLQRFDISNWLPWLVACVISSGTILLWQGLYAQQQTNFRQILQNQVNSIQQDLNFILSNQAQILKRIITQSQKFQPNSINSLNKDVINLLSDETYLSALALLDSRKKFVSIIINSKNNTAEQKSFLSRLKQNKANALISFNNPPNKQGTIKIISIHSNAHIDYIMKVYPIFIKGELKQYLVGFFNAQKIFKHNLSSYLHAGYSISISQKNQRIFSNMINQNYEMNDWLRTAQLNILDTSWNINLWPSKELIRLNTSSITPTVTLIVGMCMAILVASIIRLLQLSQQRAIELESEVHKRIKLAQELHKYTSKLEEIALHDELTGVSSRRHLIESLHHSIHYAKRYNGDLAILIIDLDYFKRVNDSYGHLIGDVVLKKIGEILLKNTRSVDIVGRYGGEEFCIILPNQKLDGAIATAEKLRQKIANELFVTPDNIQFHMTCSIGISVLSDKMQSDKELFSAADQALYTAKEQGRNQVVYKLEND